MAEMGFVVVMIDSMGTATRCKTFHDAAWGNVGDAGFPGPVVLAASGLPTHGVGLSSSRGGRWASPLPDRGHLRTHHSAKRRFGTHQNHATYR